MKYGTLTLLAALALVAAAQPPPPPPLPSSSPAPATSAAPTDAPSTLPAPSPSPSSSALPTVDIFGNGKTTGGKPKATPTPPVNDRKGLDGVWEVAIQPMGSDAVYEHFVLKQTGQALAGTYLTKDKKKYPLSGAIEGSQVRIVVALPDGSSYVIEGKLDGTSDMIGMLTNAKGTTPFTAAYRAKEKWFDNINASPGGLGGGGGGYPPK